MIGAPRAADQIVNGDTTFSAAGHTGMLSARAAEPVPRRRRIEFLDPTTPRKERTGRMDHTPAPADPPPSSCAGCTASPRRPLPRPAGTGRRSPVSAWRTPGAFAATLLVFAGLSVPMAARAQIGVMGGYSRDSVGEFDTGAGFSLADRSDGFHTGIFLDISLGRFAVRPGIVYRRLQKAAFSGEERTPADIEIVEFPLDLRLSAPLPVVTPYLLAGPVLMFPSSARLAIDEGLAPRLVRLDIGAGLEWDIGFRLWPEIRYGTGLGGLAGSGAEAAAGESSSIETLMIRIGVSF